MKIEVKEKRAPHSYRLIIYPDSLPSTGYVMTRQDLYSLYVELRDMFQEESIGAKAVVRSASELDE